MISWYDDSNPHNNLRDQVIQELTWQYTSPQSDEILKTSRCIAYCRDG
jgi:hypothetical protein